MATIIPVAGDTGVPLAMIVPVAGLAAERRRLSFPQPATPGALVAAKLPVAGDAGVPKTV